MDPLEGYREYLDEEQANYLAEALEPQEGDEDGVPESVREGGELAPNELERLIAELQGISVEALMSAAHPYRCKCDLCRTAWAKMGPDPRTGFYGPFWDTLWEETAEMYEESLEEIQKLFEEETGRPIPDTDARVI